MGEASITTSCMKRKYLFFDIDGTLAVGVPGAGQCFPDLMREGLRHLWATRQFRHKPPTVRSSSRARRRASSSR